MLIDFGGTKQVNEVRFQTTGGTFIYLLVIAKKIVIEGCKTSNGSEFKKVGESKGK